jgi:probable F420-dependent oxidoreductase
MRIGVVFPQTEIGPDPGVVRAYTETAEGSGFKHLLVYDHVLGASTANRPEFRGPYRNEHLFHEVFVLFGYLAGFTSTLELVTGVLILPQRQTVLVAKQAAEIDVLAGGRLRLGVGTGWNDVEYTGLNERFNNRGKRSEEQIELLRLLWTQEVVDFHGRYHHVPEAGIKPLPVQRPIPLWIGGYVDEVMDRIGRMADGWFPGSQPGERLLSDLEKIARAAVAAGRDPATIQMEGRITLKEDDEQGWIEATRAWREAGATHMSINTMGQGRSPEEHIQAIARYREVAGDAFSR